MLLHMTNPSEWKSDELLEDTEAEGQDRVDATLRALTRCMAEDARILAQHGLIHDKLLSLHKAMLQRMDLQDARIRSMGVSIAVLSVISGFSLAAVITMTVQKYAS